MKKISEDPDKDNISPYKTPLIAIYDFALLTVVSLAIGVFCGFSATLMTKKMRFICHSAVAESSLLLGWAMLGYLFSEMIQMSAICTILTTSIIFSHYTWYNLSPQGQHVTTVIF
jgi:NhaP-type Na+/H+ or K+/H+ antiporter